jgi:hypothetical protein
MRQITPQANFTAEKPSYPPLVRGGTKRRTLARQDDGLHAIALDREATAVVNGFFQDRIRSRVCFNPRPLSGDIPRRGGFQPESFF